MCVRVTISENLMLFCNPSDPFMTIFNKNYVPRGTSSEHLVSLELSNGIKLRSFKGHLKMTTRVKMFPCSSCVLLTSSKQGIYTARKANEQAMKQNNSYFT